jgi:hypothetical protein
VTAALVLILAGVMSSVLVALAILHLLWALGVWWPVRDERARRC